MLDAIESDAGDLVSQMAVAGRNLLRQIADRIGEADRFLADQQLFKGESRLVSPESNSMEMETIKKERSE